MTTGAWLYLWMGLILTGLAMGHGWNRCPKDDMPSIEVIATVLTWPATLLAVMTTKSTGYTPPCKVQ